MKKDKFFPCQKRFLFCALTIWGLLFSFWPNQSNAGVVLPPTVYIADAIAGYPTFPNCCAQNRGSALGTAVGNEILTPGTVLANFPTPIGAAASSATIIGGNPNSLSVSASSGSEEVGASASASVSAFMVISGPHGKEFPVDIIATGVGSGKGDVDYTGGGASFSIGHPGCLPDGDNTCLSAHGTSFSVDTQIMVIANVIDGIGMTVSASAVFGEAGAGLDPVIEIDPAFLATHPGVEIEFSPGYFPSAGARDPRTFNLGIAGHRFRQPRPRGISARAETALPV